MHSIPIGSIALWSGSLGSIPESWQLCDGSNGTPDLRDQWVPGAGNFYNPNDTGGSFDHVHDFTSNLHPHTWEDGVPILEATAFDFDVSQEVVTGTSLTTPTRAPFHALFWIQEMGD